MSFHRCSRNGFSSLMYNNYCPFKLMFDDNSFIGAVKFSNCFSEVFLLLIVTGEIDCDKTNLLLKQYWWNAICVASVYSQHMRLMQTPYQLRTHVSAQNWFRFLWQLGVLKMSIEQKIYRWTRAKSNGNWNSWDGFNAALYINGFYAIITPFYVTTCTCTFVHAIRRLIDIFDRFFRFHG